MGKNKNVLLITADQLRAACVYEDLVQTPNLDALAADGAVSFRKHYCNSTPCGPARASIHTGCYLMNHCVTDNGSPLNTTLTNWAKVARESGGYDPVVIGYVSIRWRYRKIYTNSIQGRPTRSHRRSGKS